MESGMCNDEQFRVAVFADGLKITSGSVGDPVEGGGLATHHNMTPNTVALEDPRKGLGTFQNNLGEYATKLFAIIDSHGIFVCQLFY